MRVLHPRCVRSSFLRRRQWCIRDSEIEAVVPEVTQARGVARLKAKPVQAGGGRTRIARGDQVLGDVDAQNIGPAAGDGQGGRARAQQDALEAARALGAQRLQVVLIDTSVRPEPAARALALAAGARYLPLPQADAARLALAVQAAVAA